MVVVDLRREEFEDALPRRRRRSKKFRQRRVEWRETVTDVSMND